MYLERGEGLPLFFLERKLLKDFAGSDDELLIAALFHDIGQIIPLDTTREVRMNIHESSRNIGRVGHESIGAEYLRSLGFSDRVCRLVNSHVVAKR